MSSLLKSIDLFGENIKIYFNKQEKIKTKFGGYLSILIVITTLVFTWFIGKDIIYKLNPFNYQQQVANKKYLNSTIDKTTFPIAFALVDARNNPLTDPTFLDLALIYYTVEMDEEANVNYKEFPIKFSPCQYNDFPTLSNEDFDNTVLRNYLCPQMNSTLLHGFWSENSLTYLSVIVKLCDYDKAYSNCHSYEEIKTYIGENEANLAIMILEPQIVITNYSQPIQKYVINPFKFVSENLKIVVNLIERNILKTDVGVLFESYETEEFFKLREFQTDITLIDPKKKVLVNYDFYSSNLQTIYVRKYLKIPEILASIGGLFKLFTLIGYLINFTISHIYKNLTTIHCLFHMEGRNIDENKAERITINKWRELNIKNLHLNEYTNKNIPSIIHLKLNNKNNNTETITLNTENHSILKKIKSRIPAEIKLTATDYFQLICQRKKYSSNSVNLYNKAINRIKDYFDIIFMINKLIEIELIKKIFLNNTQIKVLENIRPLLINEENNEIDSKVNGFEEEFTNLLNSPFKTDIDNKLINLITSFH